ncbi:MAG: hypothetical protein HKN08_07800 [Gammaproteobacteria bacterium]|nr:hypothetical protein [Gammaproteobacteria bacterium]
MKTLSSIPSIGRFRSWVLIVNLLALSLLTSCSSSSSSNSSTPDAEQESLEGKVFVLGAQIDAFGTLVLYAIGTDLDGNALKVAELKTASVTVGGVSYNIKDDAELTITKVGDSDKILSLGLLTDYSNSTKFDVDLAADLLALILDSIPLVYEAQVMTFSNELETHLTWSEDLLAIQAAVLVEHSDSDDTALYDSMGIALEGDMVTEGLVERCRPAHMLVMFTDGHDNLSSVYDQFGIETIVNNDQTVVIVLGTNSANSNVLTTLAGDFGAVVQVSDPDAIEAEVNKWAKSLKNMVKITLDSSINATGKNVSITIGSQTVKVSPNTHCTLPP